MGTIEDEDQAVGVGAWVEFETSYEVMVLRKSQHFETDDEMWECDRGSGSAADAADMLVEAMAKYPDFGPERFRVYEYLMMRRAMPLPEFRGRAQHERELDEAEAAARAPREG